MKGWGAMLDCSEVGLKPISFDQPIAEQIWRSKYQYKTGERNIDHTVRDTWVRVANCLAQAERQRRSTQRISGILRGYGKL